MKEPYTSVSDAEELWSQLGSCWTNVSWCTVTCAPGQLLGVRIAVLGCGLVGIQDPRGADRKKLSININRNLSLTINQQLNRQSFGTGGL